MTDLSMLKPQMKGHAHLLVTTQHTAIAAGSGSLEVFATPMMIALMEAAAVDCVARSLPAGTTSLGTRIDVTHTAASPVGAHVMATAELTRIDGRTLEFTIEARDDRGLIGQGTHMRAVVDAARFLAKLAARTGDPAHK